jgi:hypothetical protein
MSCLKHFTEDKLFRHVYHPVKEMKAVPYIHSICVEKQFQHDMFLMLGHETETIVDKFIVF